MSAGINRRIGSSAWVDRVARAESAQSGETSGGCHASVVEAFHTGAEEHLRAPGPQTCPDAEYAGAGVGAARLPLRQARASEGEASAEQHASGCDVHPEDLL